MKILIVDDAMFMRLSIKNLLTPLGFEFAEAGNGAEAVEQYKIHKPDLTIMDITMPDMDGIEGLKRIREVDADAKVLMCSSVGYQDKVIQAIEAGASNYIIKPFNNDAFIKAVKSLVGME